MAEYVSVHGDSVYDLTVRPWITNYPPGMPASFESRVRNGVEMFDIGVLERPDAPAIYFFEQAMSHREEEAYAHALAAALLDRGIAPGDRIGLYLQNDPQFVIALHAAWLVGAIVVTHNPMLKARELKYQLEAFAVDKDFEDVPKGHPAYDAVIGLGKMGVFRGVSETRFGATQTASLSVIAVVIARTFAVMPTRERVPQPAELPKRLQGQWWSSGIGFCVAKGIIPASELETLDPEALVSQEALRQYLQAAFPEHEQFSEMAPELVSNGNVTRAGLAYWLWECIMDRLDLSD